MADRTEIHTDGTFNDQTGIGGWAAVIARSTAGRQEGTSSYEMELRAILEAVKMAEGPCTIVSDHEGIVGLARDGRSPRMCKPLWDEHHGQITSECTSMANMAGSPGDTT